MPLAPRPVDVPKIPGALTFYKVMSYVTGSFLLLLLGEMILKYSLAFKGGVPTLLPTGYEIEIGGAFGFIALVPAGTVTAVNGSTAILIIHGWLYVIYLFSGFRLWAMMRWPVLKFLIIALGGIVPGLSFVVEHFYKKPVEEFIKNNPTTQGAAA
jgi:integral membrane protein